jgi:DNA-directed RNA polymerase subunit beta'
MSRRDKALLVHTGDIVTAGDALTEGPLVLQDILRIKGEESLWTYMIDEVQNVYRAQGVGINDKHIELIVSQMLRKVRVENPGDTDLLPHEVIDRYRFRKTNLEITKMVRVSEAGDTDLRVGDLVERRLIKEANARAEAEGKQPAKAKKSRPATARTLLLGITKASLQSDSFLSGASFQETTKVLTEASLRGAEDRLIGLKENVLLGHLIPAGTGFRPYQDDPRQAPRRTRRHAHDDEDRMMEEAAMAAEALGADRAGMPEVKVTDSVGGASPTSAN